jgi:hypothetical protein
VDVAVCGGARAATVVAQYTLFDHELGFWGAKRQNWVSVFFYFMLGRWDVGMEVAGRGEE